MRLKFRLLTILASLALAASGCGEDDTPPSSNTDTGADVEDSTEDTSADTGADVDMSDMVTEQTTFRLGNVDIITPGGVGVVLEGLINKDIEEGTLHVLIQLDDFAGPWPTTHTLTGNAGQLADGGYTWYDGVEIDTATAEIDAEGFFTGTDTISIVFPALEPGATEPLQIPVTSLHLEGEVFLFEGNWALEGRLSGAIEAADIEGISVSLDPNSDDSTPLSQLLNPDNMDCPADAGEGNYTGWCLEADISADAVTFVE